VHVGRHALIKEAHHQQHDRPDPFDEPVPLPLVLSKFLHEQDRRKAAAKRGAALKATHAHKILAGCVGIDQHLGRNQEG
jgi:hypothetical protein